MLTQLFEGFCDLVYPNHCLICKKHMPSGHKTTPLCATCMDTLQQNIPPFCIKCSRHIEDDPEKQLCTECRITEPHFDSAWGTHFYNDTMKKLIHLFKYGNKTNLCHLFLNIESSFLSTYNIDLGKYNSIVAIPLHSTRKRERSYNQAQLLAEVISVKFGIPESRNNLVRTRNTKNQAALSQKERWTNIQGAFKIKYPSQFFERSVLIIDDLMTTGATVSEAARILKKAGAQRTDVLTLAIAK